MTNQEIINLREVFDLPQTREESKNRLRPVAYKRMGLTFLIQKTYPFMTLSDIGSIFFKDHATTLHYLKKHDDYIHYPDYKYIYNQTKETLISYLTSEKNIMHKEEKLQIECYTYFHNTYPELRGLLNYNLNNPRNEINGHLAKLMGLQKGRPDFTLYYKGKAYFCELKTETGVVSQAQKAYHRLLKEQGFDVSIIRTLEEFKNWLGGIL